MMELHHSSCLLSSTLTEHDTSMLSNALQVGSGNRGVAYIEKRSITLAGNDDATRLGKHFGGELDCHFDYQRSEAEIEEELKRVMGILATHEEYQKYRERKPTLKKQDKEQKWPYQREVAFFRALIRWQPMGRRKHRRGDLRRGRNELVAESIEDETGEECTRKHVSSHVQVLKKKLADCPEVLKYMPPRDEPSSKKSRHRSNHSKSRYLSSRHDDLSNHSGSHPYYGHFASSVSDVSRLQRSGDHTLYSVADFGMFVGVGEGHQKRVVHHFTELGRNSRLNDVHVRDTTSWHKQFPEFNFHRTEELKNRSILVCDARIKIMTIPRPSGAELSITFDLGTHPELSALDDLECSTRFFEDGKPVGQDENSSKIKQAGKVVETHKEPKGGLRIKFGAGFFGAGFWACQLQKMGNILRKASEEDQHTRAKYEAIVRRELQQLTAAQDIYRVKDGESKCLLTILWRFGQTRSSNEPGRVKWRAVSFERPQEKIQIKDSDLDKVFGPLMTNRIPDTAESTSPIPASSSLMYPSLPLEFNSPFPSNPPALDLDQITLDNITDFSHSASTTSSLGHNFSQLQALCSIADSHGLSNSETQVLQDANDFDFTGGQIAITGCLETATHLGPYESYDTHMNAQGFSSNHIASAVADFERAAHHHAMATDTTLDDLALGMSMSTTTAANMTNYVAAPKPSWPHPSLIAHLGDAAEQYSDLMAQATEGGGQMDIRGVLDHSGGSHDQNSFSGGGGSGLWKLQSAFGEEHDAGVGAAMGGVDVVGGGGQDCSFSTRKDSLVGKEGGGGDGGVLGIMELLQQSTGEDKYRGY